MSLCLRFPVAAALDLLVVRLCSVSVLLWCLVAVWAAVGFSCVLVLLLRLGFYLVLVLVSFLLSVSWLFFGSLLWLFGCLAVLLPLFFRLGLFLTILLFVLASR